MSQKTRIFKREKVFTKEYRISLFFFFVSYIDVDLEQVQFSGHSNYAKDSMISEPFFDARYGLGICRLKSVNSGYGAHSISHW